MNGDKRNGEYNYEQNNENNLLNKEDVLDDDILLDSRGNFELPSFDSLDEQLETFYNSATSKKTKKKLDKEQCVVKQPVSELEGNLNHFPRNVGSHGTKSQLSKDSSQKDTNYEKDSVQQAFCEATSAGSYFLQNAATIGEGQSSSVSNSLGMKEKSVPINVDHISHWAQSTTNTEKGWNMVQCSMKADKRHEINLSEVNYLKQKPEVFSIGEQVPGAKKSNLISSFPSGQTMKLNETSTLSERSKGESCNNWKNQKQVLPQDMEVDFVSPLDRRQRETQRDYFRQECNSLPLTVSFEGDQVKKEGSFQTQNGHASFSSSRLDEITKKSVGTLQSSQRQFREMKSNIPNKNSILTCRFHRFPLKPKILFGIIELLHFLRKRGLPSNDPRYFILMKLLKAHTVPHPNSILTFRHLFALRIQHRIYYELKRGGKPPEEIINASHALTFGKEFTPRVVETKKTEVADANLKQIQSLPFPVESFSSKLQFAPLDGNFIRKEADRLLTILSRKAVNKIDSKLAISECNEDILRRSLHIQRRKANLVVFQRKLRRKLLEERKLAEEQGKLGSKSRVRSFRSLMKEAEKMERFMMKEMEAQERERRKNYLSFLSQLMSHVSNFRQYHKEYVYRCRKTVVRSVIRYHEDKARAAERAEKEAERRRIIALKENDEEAYVNLLRQTKNERLLQVLNQTDEYLRHLGAVVKQQRDGASLSNDPQNREATNHKTDVLSRENSQTYYEIAHAVKEPIGELPSILQGGTLKQYQIQGLQWLVSLYVNHLNGILADEMGLGKTIQAIALLAYLVEKKNNSGPFLIVVPLSTLSNWELELEKWAPSLRVVVFKGDRKQRKLLYDTIIQPLNFNVCLTTYEYVTRGKNLLGKIEWNYLIVDEGHRMKNHESRITCILSQQFKSRSRLLMTGTPLQNSLSELWSLLNFVLPNIFSSSETFESWFSAPFASIPGEKADLSEEETLLIIRRLHQVLRPFLLRRLKSDVLRMGDQLPNKQEHVVLCDISSWQKMVYRRILRGQKVVFTGISGRRRHDFLSNPAMQLRKMANHPYLFYEDYSKLMLEKGDSEELCRASGKFYMFDMLLTKFLETGHRVLVFNQMTRVIDLQERLLRLRGIPFLRLDGSTKAEVRRNIVEEFNSSNTIYHVLLLTTRAGGLGVNLQSADTVIIFDSDWNPQMDLQAQDRAHRIGQDKQVLVLRIVAANTIEERILERASYKKDMEQKVIRAGMFNETSKDSDRQALLRELLKDDEERSMESQSRVPDAETINAMIARTDSEMEIFQRIDEKRRAALNGRPPLMEVNEIPLWVFGGEDRNEEEEKDTSEYDNVPKELESWHTFSDDEISYQASETESGHCVPKRKQPDEVNPVCSSGDYMRKIARSDSIADSVSLLEREDRESEYSDSYAKSISERASEGLNGSLCFTDDDEEEETCSRWWQAEEEETQFPT